MIVTIMDECYISITIIIITMIIVFNMLIYPIFLKYQFWVSVNILYSLVTLGQTVREITTAPEYMKSEHSSMVFSRDRFTC